MSYATIEALRANLGGTGDPKSPEYAAKMLHPVPVAPTAKREDFICRQAAGKRVLDLGATGTLHEALGHVAATVVGIDLKPADGVMGFDLDDVGVDELPVEGPFGLIVAGEILEHLTNPGWLLTRLRRQFPGVPLIVTVPNAFSAAGARHIARGVENVNAEHVAWYSPSTIAALLTRVGYTAGALYYYNGDGPTAEGLIVCAE